MYVVSDAFPSQAAHASTLALGFLPGRPAVLAVVKKARVELRALPDALASASLSTPPDPSPDLLSVVAEIPVVGSIISIRSVPRPGQHTSVLLVLVDPGDEHVLLITAERARPGAAYTFDVRANASLTFTSSMPAQSGMGMWTDPQVLTVPVGDSAIDVPVAVYTRSRVLGFLSLRLTGGAVPLGPEHKTELPLPHADVLSIAPLYRSSLQDPATYAVLGISSFPDGPIGTAPQGLPVLFFATLPRAGDKGFAGSRAVPEPWVRIAEHPGPDESGSPAQPKAAGAKRKKSSDAPQSGKGKGKASQVDTQHLAWVDAHVPLDPFDALSAHLITSLPLSAGGGVLVFTEQAVLHVPPPLGMAAADTSGSESRKRSRTGKALWVPRADEREVIKAPLTRPVQVVAATPIEAGDAGRQTVLFATHGGDLYVVHIDVDDDGSVRDVSVHAAGNASKPAGPAALTHLGDGYVHIASASGDVMVVQVRDGGREGERSPASSQPEYRCTVMHRWPQIGPVLGMALAGERRVAFGSRYSTAYDDQRVENSTLHAPDFEGGDRSERIITASGTEGSGSIRTLRHGVSLLPIYTVDFPSQPSTRQWLLSPGGAAKLLVRNLPGEARWLRLQPGKQEADVTRGLESLGCTAYLAVVQVQCAASAQLPFAAALVVTRERVCVVNLAVVAEGRVHETVVQTYEPFNGKPISAATASADGRVVLASSGERSEVQAVKVTVSSSPHSGPLGFTVVSRTTSEPIASLALSPPGKDSGLVAIGTWERTDQIRLVPFAQMGEDATPRHVQQFFRSTRPGDVSSSGKDHGRSSARLTSLLLHHFTEQDSGLLLLAGWADGTLLYTPLQIASRGPVQDASACWTRVAVGKTALSLSPVALPEEKTGILVGKVKGRPSLLTLPPHPPIISEQGWTGMPGLKVHTVDADAAYASPISGGEDPVAAFFSQTTCSLARWGPLEPWSVHTFPLGDNQPTCLLQTEHGLVVGTWPFQRYGDMTDPVPVEGNPSLLHDGDGNPFKGTEGGPHGSIRLIVPDANGDFNMLHTVVPLAPLERPNCLCSFRSPEEYSFVVAIGTGIMRPDKTEVTEGRIIIIRMEQDVQDVWATHVTDSNVFALTQVGAERLVAAHNGSVSTFSLHYDPDFPEESCLKCEISWDSAFVATSLSPVYEGPIRREHRFLDRDNRNLEVWQRRLKRRWDFVHTGSWRRDGDADDDSDSDEEYNSYIPRAREWDTPLVLVGDAMRSTTLLKVPAHEIHEMEEMARDAHPVWTNAVGFLDLLAQFYVSSDVEGNLIISRRKVQKKFYKATEELVWAMRADWDPRGFEYSKQEQWQMWEDKIIFDRGMERFARFNYGDVINLFVRELPTSFFTSLALPRPVEFAIDDKAPDETQVDTLTGTLSRIQVGLQGAHTMRKSKLPADDHPTDCLPWMTSSPLSLFASVGGAIGLITHVDGEATVLLRALEYNLAHLLSVGNMAYAQWRYPNPSPNGVLDYTLLQRFLTLTEAQQRMVLAGRVMVPNGRAAPKIHASPTYVAELVRSLSP